MLQRSSYVGKVRVTVISFASILQLGDSCIINGMNKALAVQREEEIDYGSEGNFASYSAFYEPIPLPPINENICVQSQSLYPIIKVNNMHITGASSSSVLHVGNTQHISMEARVKHIRQLLPREEERN